MGAVLYVSSIANEYKSDEHCFRKTIERLNGTSEIIKRTTDELYKKSLKKGEASAIYVPIFDYGARYYSESLSNKPISERHKDPRINKLYRYCDGGQSRFPGITYSVLSLTINGKEYSLKNTLTKIELPTGEYDATLNIVFDYNLDTYKGKFIEEHLKFQKTCHIYLEEGYNFLQIKGTVFFEKTYSGDALYIHEIIVYVFEAPTRLDFDMKLIPFKEFDFNLPGNQYDIPYPGNLYFKYGFNNDTLFTDEEREAELKKASLALSGRYSIETLKSSLATEPKMSDRVAVNQGSSVTKANEKQSGKAQPTVEKKPQPKPDRVGIYGRDSQLSKAMQIMNDSSKEAVDDLNASYNELMSVLRSNKPKYTPTPKKPEPVEERPDPMWEAEKRAHEEQLRQEEEEKRKKEAELEARRKREEEAEKAKIEAAERRKAIETAEKEKQYKKAEEERKERDRSKKEERLTRIAAEKNTPKASPHNEIKNELIEKYRDIFSFKGDTLLEYRGAAPNVTVPDFVKKIDCKFFHNKSIKTVKIEADISTLNEKLFSNTEIEEVILPKSVKRIEKQCFKGCRCLRKISGGENISFIGEEAFMGCESLASLDIHTSVVSLYLERSCFKDCKSLKSIHIKCAELPDGCFEGCEKLVSIYIKDVKFIGKRALCNCTSLEKFVMNAIMKSNNEKVGEIIKESAFEKCAALKYIEIPAKSILIENGAFTDCHSLSLVHFSYDPTASEKGDITGKCDFAKVFVNCPSIKKIVYRGDNSAVKSLDPSGKCPFKIKNKLKEKDIK